MPVGFNIFICGFFLSISGLFNNTLKKAGIRTAVAAVYCILCAFFGLLEDIAIVPSVFINIGGFIIPLFACILIILKSRSVYPVLFAVVSGSCAYLFCEVFSSAVLVVTDNTVWVLGFITLAVSAVLCVDAKQALCSALLGFYFAEIIGYIDGILHNIPAYAALGSGSSFGVVATISSVTLLIHSLVRTVAGQYFRRTKPRHSS